VDFLLLCLLAANALQIRQVRIEREEALLKSARLEIELLKRHIQPHFLMNTLTALSEWIEEAPSGAASMIHALADEFKTLSEVSNKSLIPMKDELRLCSSHLEIMSRRKGCQFVLQSDGVDPECLIPPAVIHTLVENAITHSRALNPEVVLKLRAENRNGRTKYVFEAPTGRISKSEENKSGTGFRYIRARLQESYGSNWEFNSAQAENLWITEISIPSNIR
jgi:LytS/YehU family sensor histidine kinase